jgi:hypothetical protein
MERSPDERGAPEEHPLRTDVLAQRRVASCRRMPMELRTASADNAHNRIPVRWRLTDHNRISILSPLGWAGSLSADGTHVPRTHHIDPEESVSMEYQSADRADSICLTSAGMALEQ